MLFFLGPVPHPAESAFSRRVEGKAQNHFEETNSSSQNSSGECVCDSCAVLQLPPPPLQCWQVPVGWALAVHVALTGKRLGMEVEGERGQAEAQGTFSAGTSLCASLHLPHGERGELLSKIHGVFSASLDDQPDTAIAEFFT